MVIVPVPATGAVKSHEYVFTVFPFDCVIPPLQLDILRTLRSVAPAAKVPARAPVYEVGVAPTKGTATNPRQVVVADANVTRYFCPPIYEVTTLLLESFTVKAKPFAVLALLTPWLGQRRQES